MKKTVISIATSITMLALLILAVPVSANAKTTCAFPGCKYEAVSHSRYCSLHTCQSPDCYNLRNNGTVYCDTHAAKWLQESGKKACCVSGCYSPVSEKHTYCSSHECRERDCTSKRAEGSEYCSRHDKNSVVKSTPKPTSKPAATKSTSYKQRTYKKKKKYDQYDVYSYKNAQDFADDKYEEFYDYEDDYEDEDEAYEAAEDYWESHH